MLNKKIFKEGMRELEVVFDRFSITEGKIRIWYRFFKDLGNDEWKEKLRNCIWCCHEIPTIAHVLDEKGYYVEKAKYFIEEIKQAKRTEEIAELESIWNIS